MWMQISKEQGEALLAVVNDDPAVKYFQDRVRHYQEIDTQVAARFRKAAKEYTEDGDLEFDDDACVSVGGDPGAYVMGWKWIGNAEAGFNSEAGSETLKVRGAK